MRTHALASGRFNEAGSFRPMPMMPRRSRLGAAASTQAIQQNLMQPTPVPNWGIYAGSALLVAGGVVGLMAPEKSVFSIALGATMIGVGGFLFFQTLKQG